MTNYEAWEFIYSLAKYAVQLTNDDESKFEEAVEVIVDILAKEDASK